MTRVESIKEMINRYINTMPIGRGEAVSAAMICRWVPRSGYSILPTVEDFNEAANQLISEGILTKSDGKYFVA